MSKLDVKTSFDVHVGILGKHLEMMRRQLRAYSKEVFVDGDSWEVWGEGTEQGGNDDSIYHVIMRVKDRRSALFVSKRVARVHGDRLMPMREQPTEKYNGTIVSVTTAEDWSIDVLDIHESTATGFVINYSAYSEVVPLLSKRVPVIPEIELQHIQKEQSA